MGPIERPPDTRLARPVSLDDIPPLVVLVGKHAKDHRRIDDLREVGAVIIIASSLDAVHAWLPAALSGQPEEEPPHVVIQVDHLEVDLTERRARWREIPLDLTEHELEILAGG